MSEQLSYSKFEHEILPAYRNRLNQAESTEDVKKFFTYTVLDLFQKAFASERSLHYEDISLKPDCKPPYALSPDLENDPQLTQARKNSDLDNILDRLSRTAANRYLHLSKNPEKTEAKIRQ